VSVVESALQQHVHALYSNHHGWLCGWLRKRLGDAHHAADLAHDIFLRVLSAHEPAHGRRQDRQLDALREPRAYLTTVAGRVLLNHYRRRSLEQAWLVTLAQLPDPCAPSPEDCLIILETLNEIDVMLNCLPPKVRAAFLLSQLEGLTYAQIARQLGVTVRTVKRYMAQAFEECLMREA
jgi:RNA polymerase sigma factor (sigma-70 family)